MAEGFKLKIIFPYSRIRCFVREKVERSSGHFIDICARYLHQTKTKQKQKSQHVEIHFAAYILIFLF